MGFQVWQNVLAIIDSYMTVSFLLKFNKYKLKEKKVFWLLAPVVLIITILTNNYFDLLTILNCIVVCIVFMQLCNFNTHFFRKILGCILFYATLMVNNTIMYLLYNLCYGYENELYYKMDITYVVMCIISKITLFIFLEIYIYIAGNIEEIDFVDNIRLPIVITIANIGAIATCMYFYLEKIINIKIVIIFIMISIVISLVVSYYMYAKLSLKSKLEIELQLEKQKILYEQKNYFNIKKQFDYINITKHDMKNHLAYIKYYITSNNNQMALNYINNYCDKMNLEVFFPLSNVTLNFIINYKVELAQKHDIQCEGYIENIKNIEIDKFDLCSLIGNLMDNAIEAEQKESKRKIIIRINRYAGYFVILIQNKIEKSVLNDNINLNTTKQDSNMHGYGIQQIKNIVERYNGLLDIYEKNNYFCVKCMLHIKN